MSCPFCKWPEADPLVRLRRRDGLSATAEILTPVLHEIGGGVLSENAIISMLGCRSPFALESLLSTETTPDGLREQNEAGPCLTGSSFDKANTVTCECPDWAEGLRQIVGAQVMSEIHSGSPYTAARFRFCPWCGKLLESPAMTLDELELERQRSWPGCQIKPIAQADLAVIGEVPASVTVGEQVYAVLTGEQVEQLRRRDTRLWL